MPHNKDSILNLDNVKSVCKRDKSGPLSFFDTQYQIVLTKKQITNNSKWTILEFPSQKERDDCFTILNNNLKAEEKAAEGMLRNGPS